MAGAMGLLLVFRWLAILRRTFEMWSKIDVVDLRVIMMAWMRRIEFLIHCFEEESHSSTATDVPGFRWQQTC